MAKLRGTFRDFNLHPVSRLRWDSKFTKRNAVPNIYAQENQRPFKPTKEENARAQIESFFEQQTHVLQTKAYSYQALCDFLFLADLSIFEKENSTCMNWPEYAKCVLFDERMDDRSLDKFLSRHWKAYEDYPPRGCAEYTALLSCKELYEKLVQPRAQLGESSPERRSIYIQDLSPSCAVGIILAVPSRYAPFLRDFLSRYITNRVYFGVSMDSPLRPATPYAMEFHIPYFALRRSSNKAYNSPVGRRSGIFADSFTRNCKLGEQEFFHEVQISILLVGIDEWVWTLYCLVETHFEDPDKKDYLNKCFSALRDAPSGSAAPIIRPIWNPREYFLLVLCRRMGQAKLEWRNLVETLEQRLRDLEDDTFIKPSSELLVGRSSDLQRVNDYTWAIQVLQLFTNQLVKTIESWQEFSGMHLSMFHSGDDDSEYSSKVPSYLQSLDRDVSELRHFHTLLWQRIAAFESRRNMIINTSALMETRISNEQAADIGLLTKVTVFYLPLGLITAIFSMTFMQESGTWGKYVAVLFPFAFLSVFISFNLQSFKIAIWWVILKVRMKMRSQGNTISQLEAGMLRYSRNHPIKKP